MGVRSSYLSDADFGAVLAGIVFAKRPLTRVAEYGILDGFSLDILERFSPPDAVIEARDIFEDFKGNRPARELLDARFGTSSKVIIQTGDFNDAGVELEDGAYDLIHVDIANTGDIYEKAARMLLPKLRPGGVILLEGGTPERDEVSWMRERNKRPICPVVDRWLKEEHAFDVCVLGKFPGLTLLRPLPTTGEASPCAVS